MPVWVMRAFGVWAIVAGVGQFFLIRLSAVASLSNS